MSLAYITCSGFMLITTLQMLTAITSAMVLPSRDPALLQVQANGSSHGLLNNEVPMCVHNSDWGSGIRESDCHIVINYLYDHYKYHLFYQYEFTSLRAPHSHAKHVVRTPIKIHHGIIDPTLK